MNPTKTPPGVEQLYARDGEAIGSPVNPTKTPPGVEQIAFPGFGESNAL